MTRIRRAVVLVGRFVRWLIWQVQRATERAGRLIRRALPPVLRLALFVTAGALAAGATWLIVWQPATNPLDTGTIIAIAGIVATVLSLGLTVTLIVAQHTAERHAHVLYTEFRREGAWLQSLGLLAIGVLVIVAAALWHPTISTGWGSVALMAALGVSAAARLPALLNSLDRTELARRLTDRSVRELRKIARTRDRFELEPALKPVARRGLEIAHLLAVEGINSNDREVVAAGFAGIRRVLVAYIAASPYRGFDSEIINFAFQSIHDATERCARQSPVLLLPAAIEELTALGVEHARVLLPEDNDSVSGRLNGRMLDIVAWTLTNDESAAPAMATAAIGDSGDALIRAGQVNPVTDHIRTLDTIALVSLRAERDHVTGEANRDLARIALALAALGDADDLMPRHLFHDAAEAIAEAIDAFVARTSPGSMIPGSGHALDHGVARRV